MSVQRRVMMATSAIAVAGAIAIVFAAPVAIRLSTVAPPGTTWDTALRKMGADWAKTTDSRVTLHIIPSGGSGEPTLVRYLRPEVNNLDAALLTAGGLASIDNSFTVFGIPFFFQSDDEEQYVRGKLEPMLIKKLEANHYKLLSWGHGGWVQLFSTIPIKTLAELKAARLFTSNGDPAMAKWYTSNGFHPVPLEPTTIATSMATGTINATPMPPYGAVVTLVSRSAKYMLDINVDPLIGALILTESKWNAIDAGDRDNVLAAARGMGSTLQTDVPKQDATSVSAMQAKGLTVTQLDAAGLAAFRGEADKLAGTMRGNMVPADVYDAAHQARDEYRKSHKK